MAMNEGQESRYEALAEMVAGKMGFGARNTGGSSLSTCIYRVSEKLRKVDESAYTPRLVSIGPLHSKDNHLLKTHMQHGKMRYANALLCRPTGGSEDHKFELLKRCLQEMRKLIDAAKACYAEEVVELDEEMLFLDGCFIIELLYRNYCYYHRNNPKEEANGGDQSNEMEDPIFGSLFIFRTVQHDLLLLENQIPFFVLEKLFLLTVDRIEDRDRCLSLTDYIFLHFDNAMTPEGKGTRSSNATSRCDLSSCCRSVSDFVLTFSSNTRNSEEEGPTVTQKGWEANQEYCHLLHILHVRCVPRDPSEGKGLSEFVAPSASNLNYAGVKFVAGPGKDQFKVKFSEATGLFWWCHRARFEIPPIGIYESTEPILRNLIAFEQVSPVPRYLTSYAFLMGMLVKAEGDVRVLQKAGVIHNYLGDNEEVSDLFNKLRKEVFLGEFFFAGTCKETAEYIERCWPAAMAYVRNKYFATPWTFIAFCVAFIVFGMSVTQFIRSLV